MNNQQEKNFNKYKTKHIVILHGASLQYSGPNQFIMNNCLAWKKLGYKITIICQDRDAKNMKQVDSYIQGDFSSDAPVLAKGQIRVIVPHINNLIPIPAEHKACNFQGVQCKTIQQMTDQQIQTNIQMTVKCLTMVCDHDRPIKVLANNIIFSGIIAQRGLKNTGIRFDITVPGPALRFTLMPYPHLWKWVLPAFQDAVQIYHRTQFVQQLFLKVFRNYVQKLELDKKSVVTGPGLNPQNFSIPNSYQDAEKQFINSIMNCAKEDLIHKKQRLLASQSCSQLDLLSKWIPCSESDETVLFLGALMNKMGAGQLLAIAPKLLSQRPTLKFIFSGIGPLKKPMLELLHAFEQGDVELAIKIAKTNDFITDVNIRQNFAQLDKKLRQRIIFTDILDQKSIAKLMPLCHIYIAPGKLPQQCTLSVIEAMCFGVIPICNNHSWFAYVMKVIASQYPQLYETVFIPHEEFFQRLPDTIIKTLNFIQNSKISKKQYKKKVRQIVEKDFSWEHTAETMASLQLTKSLQI